MTNIANPLIDLRTPDLRKNITETWIWYDGPMTGTLSINEVTYIFNAYASDYEGDPILYIYVTVNPNILEQIRNGTVPMIAAYQQPDSEIFIETENPTNHDLLNIEAISYVELTRNHLPHPTATLKVS